LTESLINEILGIGDVEDEKEGDEPDEEENEEIDFD